MNSQTFNYDLESISSKSKLTHNMASQKCMSCYVSNMKAYKEVLASSDGTLYTTEAANFLKERALCYLEGVKKHTILTMGESLEFSESAPPNLPVDINDNALWIEYHTCLQMSAFLEAAKCESLCRQCWELMEPTEDDINKAGVLSIQKELYLDLATLHDRYLSLVRSRMMTGLPVDIGVP